MLSSRALTCSSAVLRLFQNTKSVQCSKLIKHVQNGYISPKLSYAKCLCSSADTNEIENVYYGILTPKIKAVKVISFTTSIGGLIAQPIILNQVQEMGGNLAVLVGLCSFVGFFTFVTPLLLHLVTKKYVTHLDYDPETKKYCATVLNFFCMRKEIEFDLDDVKIPDIPGMFTTFEVNGRSLFVDPSQFRNPHHYGKLMGYDKPIDFKMSETIDEKKE